MIFPYIIGISARVKSCTFYCITAFRYNLLPYCISKLPPQGSRPLARESTPL